jgi:hypothetical protein
MAASRNRDTSTQREPSHDEPQPSRRPRNTSKLTIAQLAQTTAAIQSQLAQVNSTIQAQMAGLATAVERHVHAASILQTQPPFLTPTSSPAPTLEPPRMPGFGQQYSLHGNLGGSQDSGYTVNGVQAVPLSSPGNFGTMPLPNQRQQPNSRVANAPRGVPRGYSVMKF